MSFYKILRRFFLTGNGRVLTFNRLTRYVALICDAGEIETWLTLRKLLRDLTCNKLVDTIGNGI